MRYVEGPDLKALLREQGKLEPGRAVAICAQIASALDAAHERGLVHRDVKPSNVLLDAREDAYLADFGLSRRLDQPSLSSLPGPSLGTPAYAAPEQITGADVDGRADVYSLGCLFYECLTGEPPFTRESDLRVLWAHLQEDAPAPPGYPVLASVFATALAKHPDNRYATCTELIEATAAAFDPVFLERGAGGESNLPVPATAFLGREAELREVVSLLLQSDERLLTLTGPGGTGKTRLALQAAAAADAFPDGVWWVPLAALRDPQLVLPSAVQALGAEWDLPAHIGDRSMLVLLDSFEHVIEAAPELPRLLASCRRLRLVVTSRELLRVGGEIEYSVPPMAESDAVELFCHRSRLEADGTVAELCRRLDNCLLRSSSPRREPERSLHARFWSVCQVASTSSAVAGTPMLVKRRCERRSTGHTTC